MSSFYKPNRNPLWNYGGPNWRLSRSKIDLFVQCPKCFYIDNRLGVARPPGFPFNLNSAVDHLLKKEFDIHRAKGEPHPLMKTYGVDAVPFAHKNMDLWRENFKGIDYRHAPTGFTVSGAVDDIWVGKKGELYVVDYKSTSKDEDITALDEEWHDGYKRQMSVYQWLLRKNGFTVSDTGYFVYANGRKDKEAFDGKLEFTVTLIPYVGDDSWIEPILTDIKKTLDGGMPESSKECDHCRYRESADAVEQRSQKGVPLKGNEEPTQPLNAQVSKKARPTGSIKTQEELF
jgi:CRISPR/Cas system-associated exonuclease Cas4 (RecB family)